MVKVRGDCLICWNWWQWCHCWSSLFKISFHKRYIEWLLVV